MTYVAEWKAHGTTYQVESDTAENAALKARARAGGYWPTIIVYRGKKMDRVEFTKATMVKTIKRLTNSRNGNPRYKIEFENGVLGTTKPDAGFAYAIWDGMKQVTVKYYYTQKGDCVITDLTEHNGESTK